MAYIEAHQAIMTHRKTLRLARLLGIDKWGVVGRLVALWQWAIDNAPDGDLGADCADILAEVMGWTGEPEQLVGALTQAGFLDRADGGAYLLHDWWDYAGRLIEKRQSDAARKRAERARSGHPAPQSHPVLRTSEGHPRDGAGNVPYPTVINPTVPEDTDKSDGSGDWNSVADAGASLDADVAPTGADVLILSGISEEEPTGQPTAEAPKPAPVKIAADAPAMRLAIQLREGILAHNSTALDARKAMTGQGIQAWARKLDALMADPRRAPPDVEAVIAYATSHTRFWQAIVLNPDKLKKHYDTINGQRLKDARMPQQETGGSNGNGSMGRSTASQGAQAHRAGAVRSAAGGVQGKYSRPAGRPAEDEWSDERVNAIRAERDERRRAYVANGGILPDVS